MATRGSPSLFPDLRIVPHSDSTFSRKLQPLRSVPMNKSLFACVAVSLIVGVVAVHAQKNKPPPTVTTSALRVVDSLGQTVGTLLERQVVVISVGGVKLSVYVLRSGFPI